MARTWMYHNPGCKHSRGTHDILRERGIDVDVVEYLDHPLTRQDFEQILDLLSDEPAELVRKDKHFASLGLDPDDYRTRDQVIDLLLEHPVLMQRPVVFVGDRAVISRPAETVLEILD